MTMTGSVKGLVGRFGAIGDHEHYDLSCHGLVSGIGELKRTL